jgi:hypothetical protein
MAELQTDIKWGIVIDCLSHYDDTLKSLKAGALKMLEEKWNVSKREIQRVFKEYRDKKAIDPLHVNLSPNKKGVVGMVSKLSIDVRRRIQTISDLAMGKLTYQIIRDQL